MKRIVAMNATMDWKTTHGIIKKLKKCKYLSEWMQSNGQDNMVTKNSISKLTYKYKQVNIDQKKTKIL